MLTRKRIPLREVFVWSSRDILLFLLISVIPVVLYEIAEFRFLILPWLPIAVLGTAVAFVTSFRNNACYDRLWEARKIWGGIVNSSRSWTIMVRDFINNKHVKNEKLSNEELKGVKLKLIKRHVAWMAAHRYMLRSSRAWETTMQEKRNADFIGGDIFPEHTIPLEDELSQYLDKDELAYVLSKSNKATTLISLQSKHIKDLESKGHLWEFSYLEMEKMLVEFYTLQGKNERIKNFPYPRQFATLNFMFVWIFILLLPFGVMGSFDEMGVKLMQRINEANSNSISFFIASNFVWLTVPFCAIISWVFNSIEYVGKISENPFEGTPNDIPMTSMSRSIEIDLLEMLDEENIPEPYQNVPGLDL